MNVFVLCTGRCGSVTLKEASKYISNYTVGHEVNAKAIGDNRLEYPDNHIEIDNRLSWVLGRLDKLYGDNAIYIHLKRNPREVAVSYSKRNFSRTLHKGYATNILMRRPEEINPIKVDICEDMVHTINTNIELFLKDKTNVLEMNIESIEEDFKKYWDFIKAEGNFEAALNELKIKHNKGK